MGGPSSPSSDRLVFRALRHAYFTKDGKVTARSRPKSVMPSQSMTKCAIEMTLPRLTLCGLAVLLGACAPALPYDGAGGTGAGGRATGGTGTTAGTGGSSTVGTGGVAPTGSGGSTASGGASGATGGSGVETGGSGAGTGGSGAGTGGSPTGSGGSNGGGSTAVGTGGRSGGAGGRAGTGGAGGQVISAVCPSTALVCDDFEDGNLDGWVKMESGGTLAIDTAHASSGKSALGITMATGQRGGWLQKTGSPLFPLPMNAMYGRMMVYFESLPAGHTDFVRGAASAGGGNPWYNVGEQTGKVLLNYYSSSSDCWARPSPSNNIPLNVWTCWEWGFDGPKNQMLFYINSQLSRTVNGVGDGCTGSNVWTAPTFNYLSIGAYNAQPANAPSVGKMWIDDIAVGSTARIGCPAPATL
jgi:hypothetical protein